MRLKYKIKRAYVLRGVQPWYNNYELQVKYFSINKKYKSIDYR